MKRIMPGFVIFLLLWSCASGPKPADKPADTTTSVEPTETKPVETPVETKSTELPPADLLEQAKSLKKKAFDLTLFEIMPDEYKTADNHLTEGIGTYEKDNAASKVSLTKAVESFTDLIEKGTILLSAKRREQADTMKAAALQEGAQENYPSMMETGDALYADADAKESAKDYESASEVFAKARLKYEIAMKKAKSGTMRARIEGLEFAQYDQGNFDLADKKFAETDEYFETDPDKSLDAVDESLLRFNLVLRKGFEYTAGTNRQKTEEEKAKADGIKAAVAVKDDYAQALAVYEEGVEKQNSQDFEGASGKFADAETMFTDAYLRAQEKRERAEAALKEYEAAKVEGERKADEAATKIGGTK